MLEIEFDHILPILGGEGKALPAAGEIVEFLIQCAFKLFLVCARDLGDVPFRMVGEVGMDARNRKAVCLFIAEFSSEIERCKECNRCKEETQCFH